MVYALINNGKPVFFSIATNSSYGSIAVAEGEAFKQTITLLKSDEIKKELDDKGKVVLHINFDTDKATLQPDGKTAVAEIAKVLQSDATLKLDINGYTDNTGNYSHNLQLSIDRANTVLNSLVSAGIAKNRLNANGFGSQNPLVGNDSEEGKTQNRRVELVKKS